MWKRIAKRLIGGGERRRIDRFTEIANETLRQRWESHEESKWEQGIVGTTQEAARRTTPRDAIRRYSPENWGYSRSTPSENTPEELVIVKCGRRRDKYMHNIRGPSTTPTIRNERRCRNASTKRGGYDQGTDEEGDRGQYARE